MSGQSRRRARGGPAGGAFSADDREAHIAELTAGSDRSSALVGGALVEATLRQAIMSRLAMWNGEAEDRIFKGLDAPLSSFSAKIKMGRAMNIYGNQMHRFLDAIRAIRNLFAHEVRPITFNELSVREQCNKLKMFDLPLAPGEQPKLVDRTRFIMCCINMSVALEEVALKSPYPPPPSTLR